VARGVRHHTKAREGIEGRQFVTSTWAFFTIVLVAMGLQQLWFRRQLLQEASTEEDPVKRSRKVGLAKRTLAMSWFLGAVAVLSLIVTVKTL
jgi:hypothetical protein